ncbi:endo-1,4-beta-xylanase [Pedobacter aquae]|uniref:Beta-xylanase n=1 Tax=Pedobacter aquae TaxID=2605747 RepID=A0A5C0VL49_9SPHI|nr:endo-1,4-beta-xylanase [Pedobacter aquae]QEK51714.1 endo-1,4-beta-xylanase [Pedobacter aquae]
MKKIIFITVMGLSILSCKKTIENAEKSVKPSNKNIANTSALVGNERLQTANPDVKVGVAISLSDYTNNSLYSDLVKQEYNSITAENAMKFSALQPNENNFTGLDNTIIEHAAMYNGRKRIHGHALIWYFSNPSWITYVENNTPQAERYNRFKGILEAHISKVVKHYARESIYQDANGKPLMKSWDVVNEAFNDNGTYRGSGDAVSDKDKDYSVWYRNLQQGSTDEEKGRHHIELAFRAARKAANEAGDYDLKLFYNDYGHEYSKAKTNAIYNLVNYLKTKTEGGKPIIDGVGLQFHMNYTTKTKDIAENANGNIEYAIRKMKETGLKVHISELDVSIAKREINGSINNDTTTESERKGAQYYRYYFVPQAYRSIVPDNQRWGITLWNVGDSDSWLNKVENNGFATLYNQSSYTKNILMSVFMMD